MIKKVFSATLLVFSIFNLSFSQHQQQEKWVDSVFQKLSIEEQIGQLMMVPVYSGGNEQHFQVIENLITRNRVGGIIFMQGDPLRQVKLTNRLQESSGMPLLVGMDMEWGAGMRLDSTISFPKQMALGALQNDSLIYAMGAEIARQMKVLGVHMNFAPVVDINSNPKNPVIGLRSFGSDKKLVTNKGLAYMKGLQENGALACIKHFPGHGDTSQDSHLTLPVIKHSKKRLDTLEIYPFQKLAYAGASAIMTAHLQLPALEPKTNTPASLSRKVVHNILRQELRYNGLLVTDALNMRAVTDYYEPGMAELLALQAGNDILLFPQNIPAATSLIKKAVKNRTLPKAQLEESVKRVLRAKYKAGLYHYKPLNTDNIYLKLNRPETRLLSSQLAQKAVTVAKNEQAILPISILDNKTFASLSIGPSGEFSTYLDKYSHFSHYDNNTSTSSALYQQLRNYDVVVVGIFDDENDDNHVIGEHILYLLNKLSRETQVIICMFASPYKLRPLDHLSTLVCAYENNIQTQKAVPATLFGGISTDSRLPVTVTAKLPFGQGVSTPSLGRLSYSLPEDVFMDSRVLNKIDALAQETINERATPGCQILVAKDGKIVFERSYGYYTYDSIEPVNDNTIYDIASITKVSATMQAFMFLEERGLIDLDKKVSVYLPELKGTNKEHMIIRDILTHQSGLWPYLPFWRKTIESPVMMAELYNKHPEIGFDVQVSDGLYTSGAMQDSLWQWVKDSKVREKTPRRPYDYKYSDMGYYLLKRLIERTLNQPMDQFLQQNFYDPMGLTTLSYLPLCHFPLSRIAPTEYDAYFRNTLIYGMVHDQGAALCGGVAGHAGLFSNAIDLAKLMQMHLQDGTYGGARFFQPGTIGKFTEQQYHNNRRGLGWDKPSGEWNGPTSEYASPKTFGHTGFTGTAVWADPEFNLIYVFLSNRIYPDAGNSKLIKSNIRTRIQDVIYESMWSYTRYHDPY